MAWNYQISVYWYQKIKRLGKRYKTVLQPCMQAAKAENTLFILPFHKEYPEIKTKAHILH